MLMVSRRSAAAAAASDPNAAEHDEPDTPAGPPPGPPVSRQGRGNLTEADAASGVQLIEQARQAPIAAQCGCAYWHGVFGGVYLPHLRQAVYRNLIQAETLLDAAAGPAEPWLSATIDDFNLDVHKEILLTSSQLTLLVAPERGGQLYELDVREVGTNLLATMTRRPEPYHPANAETVEAPTMASSGIAAPARLVYDAYPRKSLLDHFYDPRTTLDEIATNVAIERGDFLGGRYRARLRRVRGGICATFALWDCPRPARHSQ